MRLQSLEIQGFKSIATRTVLEFAPGITAIVGPNGAGKSNIADAVRWVLGNQNPRVLRVQRAEDVVFAGGNGRAPVGLAEVQLTLNNDGGWLPVAFREVTVARRAHRSGESEYVLNRSRVRLRDLLELLAHGGLGPEGHALIAQGLADQALDLRPEQRRELFEDASGVRQYRLQRAEAERKVAEARRNAARVADLVAELRPRAASLRRQARRAEQEIRLRAQWRATLEQWLAHALWEANRAISDRTTALAEATAAASAADQEVVAATAVADDARRELASVRAEVQQGAAADSERRARRQVLALERAVAAGAARLEAARREAQERQQAADEAAARAAQAEAELPQLQAQARAAAAAAQERAAILAAATEQLAPAEQRAQEAARALTDARAAVAAARQRRAQAEEGLRAVARRRVELTREREEADGELARLAAELAALTPRMQAAQRTWDEATAALRACRERQARLKDQCSAAQGEVARAERSLAEVERTLAAALARLGVLQDVRARRSGRSVSQRRPTSDEVERVPAVAARLIVPARLERAVAAAAGAALRWRLATDLDEASTVARRVADRGAPRTTIAARAGLARWCSVRPALPELSEGTWLHQLIEASLEDAVVVQAVLGRVLLVDTLDRALALARVVPPAAEVRFVTPRGDLVEPWGAVTTGGEPAEDVALLARERQLRECAAEVARREEEREQAVAAVAAARARLVAAERAEQGIALELRQAQLQRQRAEADRQAVQRDRERLQRDRQWWATLVERADRSAAELAAQAERLTAARQSAVRALAAARDREATLIDAEETVTADLRRLREEQAAARAEAAVARQAARTASEAAQAAEQRAMQARREATKQCQRAAAASQVCSHQTVQADRERLIAARTTLAAAAAALSQQRSSLVAAERRSDEATMRLTTARETAAAAASRCSAAAAQLAAMRERQQALQEQAERDLGALPSKLAPATVPPEQLREQAETLRRRLQTLGPVNQVAIDDYAAVSARLAHLTAQLADIEATATTLEQLREEVDRRLASEFTRTIEVVGHYFQEYCERLFAGNGQLVLAGAGPDAGIEIAVRLPKRRRQPLTALSGGERALVAAALLFALLRARPTPFCVLDEVDAALDETNVERFGDALVELAQETQFLLITHNRATMERADALYGVTIGPDGASRIVSLRPIRKPMTVAAGEQAAG